jgi:diadenosine tetraphosphate (Ap4A) HIT family hydrolase
MNKSNPCPLCNPDKNFDVIFKNKEIFIAFDNYQLSYSHILISPIAHQLATAKCNNINLFSPMEEIITLYNNKNMTAVIYEHGNTTENLTNNISVDHAHIHIIGMDHSLNEKLLDKILDNRWEKHKNVISCLSTDHNYSYHMLSINGLETYLSREHFPSQFFRKKYAKQLNIQHWDWKTEGAQIRENIEKYDIMKIDLKKEVSELLTINN